MAIGAIIAVVISAAMLGSAIYNDVNNANATQQWKAPSGGTGTASETPETPEERNFYEMQALAAEQEAELENTQTEIAANSADQTTSWLRNIAIIVALFLTFQIARKKNWIQV